jgi:predicted phosphodiesterase
MTRRSNTSRSPGGRIFVCGDPHGRFEQIIEAAQAYLPAGIILLGDMEAPEPLDQVLAPILKLTAIYWIIGNHDTDEARYYDHLVGSALADRRLDGRVIEIAGVRIAGLGGVFRQQIWRPPGPVEFHSERDFLKHCGRGNRWRDGLPLRQRSTIFPDVYERLKRQRADVLVTHEAPAAHPKYGFSPIDELAQAMRVKATFHGHLHEHHDYMAEGTASGGLRAYGVGLRAIMDLDGQVVVPGEPA